MDDPDRDSTWEDDEEEDGEDPGAGGGGDGEAGAPRGAEDAEQEEEEEARPSALPSRTAEFRNWRAVRDTRRYRHRYPDLIERDSNGDMPNLSFYRNEIEFLPNGCLIETVLQDWKDDYETLEDNHSYIQWLFPLREPGVNWHAKPLTLREIQEFKGSKEARARLVRAYELMLGFYGIKLRDPDSGAVCRAHNYQKRFQNLNWHSHNNLRITRILKSLGELGLERYQAPLVRFFLEETLVHRQLPNVQQSVLDYFVFTVRCPRQRRALLRFAWEHFRPRRKFVWAPHDKLQRHALRRPPRPPSPAAPGEAQGEESPGDAFPQAGACGPGTGQGGDSVAAGPQLPSPEPQEKGVEERDQGEEAENGGEEGPEPSSPKEGKKRKLEANRREQAPGEAGPQSSSEVEKVAQNLEDCALSQGAGAREMGSQEPGETEQPCAPPPGAKAADDEVRKRRKVDQSPAPTGPPAQPGPPEAGVGENGVEQAAAEDQGPGAPERDAPQSSAAEEPAVDRKAEPAEAGLAAGPRTP
ncbi:opioid growth factor receptor [Phyllostomus discolor]|uniref:Opioid growth factor receptor n=1 Tax=Phyllostomus discolor TaxID=89673 RepID=A0A6J2MJL7_9CHIR|nr:opioid growth factor receptor [Phyllostomus discolor]XP_035865905.1 opioid growth factor receptor [Phyllostomus discolor]